MALAIVIGASKKRVQKNPRTSLPSTDISSTPTPTPNPIPAPNQNMSSQNTLRDLATKRGIEIGSAVSSPSNLREPNYTKILLREFNLMVIGGNPLNWALLSPPLRPDRNTYNFSNADFVVNFAKQNNLKIQGHHLVWGAHEFLPSWLLNGNYSRDELLSIMQDHIQKVASRYQGQVHEWTVVNETISRRLFPNIFGGDFWYEKLGPDYVEKAFRWAREADPEAVLILNDFGNEGLTKISNTMYDLVKDLKNKGVPIDGIGMQMHLNAAKPPNKTEVIKNMKRFGALGAQIYITEFDVDLSKISGTREEKYATQAQIYKEMAEACLESKVCKSFSTFEFSDAKTWYNSIGENTADPLPFDRKYEPKPAYFTLREVFSNE